MSRAQRLAYLAIAVVITVVAVVVFAAGGNDDEAEVAATPATTTDTGSLTDAIEETPTAEPTPEPTPEIIVLRPGSEKRVKAKEGDRVRFRVRSDSADHVHVHGYDLLKDIEAGGEVEFSFKASITGIFEIELEDAGEPVGSLVVEP